MVSSQIPRALRHAIQCLYQSGRSHGGLCGPHRGFVYVYVRVCGVSVWGWVGEGRVLAAGCAEALPPPLTLAHLFRGGSGLPLPRQARWRRSASLLAHEAVSRRAGGRSGYSFHSSRPFTPFTFLTDRTHPLTTLDTFLGVNQEPSKHDQPTSVLLLPVCSSQRNQNYSPRT